MIRKKPWNRTDHPIYSISSKSVDGSVNMNIITYVTAITMHPKRFICGIYEHTKTLENVSAYPYFILQLLSDDQYKLVSLLGRQSGHDVNKIGRLEKRNILTDWLDFKILTGCNAVMQMKVINKMNAGDHTAFLCEVLSHKNINNKVPLTLNTLRQKKLIRI